MIRLIRQIEHTPNGPPHHVERWYDWPSRTWVAYPADADGNQLGPCQHAHRKTWLTLDLAAYELDD